MEWESSNAYSEDTNSTQDPGQHSSISLKTDQSSQIAQLPSSPPNQTTETSCQTEDTVVLTQEMYDELVFRSAAAFDLKDQILKVRQRCTELFGDEGSPEMDPKKFEIICQQAGADRIFPFIYNALCHERMSESRSELNRVRAMVIIYMMVFGQSQKSNWFQVALSRTLSSMG